MQIRKIVAVMAAAGVLGVSGVAVAQAARSPAETASYRHDQFRRMGGAFKSVNDGVRAREPNLAALRASAQTISQLANELPTWFPAGSGPGNGFTTKAKAEIWSNADGFTSQSRQFRAAAQALASSADINAYRTNARAVGAQCASCHVAFRERD